MLSDKPFCGEKCGAPVAPGLMETMRLTPQIRSSSMRSKDLFDRLLSFLFRLCCVESESVCLSLSDECIWFWWSLSLSDDVTEGSPEAFRPTVLYRSDESLRVASVCVVSQDGGGVLRAKPFCGEKSTGTDGAGTDRRRSDRLHQIRSIRCDR